jgi:hypothetical protein
MTTDQPAHERFATRIKPRPRRTDRVTENDDFLAMLHRFATALEARCIADPSILPHCVELEQRFREIANVTIAVNAARFHANPHSGASMAECARAMGISDPSASERRKRGNAIIAARNEQAGVPNFTEAKRVREIIRDVDTKTVERLSEFGVTSIEEYRARHRVA